MTGSERRWALRFGIFVLALTVLPLVVAIAAAPRGTIFSGFVYVAADGVSYVAKALEGLNGHWLYHDPYTSEAQTQTLVYAPYVLLGQLDRILHLPLPLLLQLARLVLAGLILDAVWRLAVAAVPGVGARRLVVILVLAGGGIGALTGAHADIFGYHYVSVDVGVAGAVGLEALNLAPHILIACLGSAWLLLLWVRQEEQPTWWRAVGSAAWTLAISTAYPQLAALWALILAVCWLSSRRVALLPTVIAVGAAALPYALYGLYLKSTNPIFANWPPQSDIDLGDPLSFLVFGHLVMLPFTVIAMAAAWRRRGDSAGRLGVVGVAGVWLLVAGIVMYLPGFPSVVHRVFCATFIPFGVLAADGLWRWATARPRPSRRRLVYPTILMSIAGLWTVGEGITIPLLHRDDQALYFPNDDATALRSLAAQPPGFVFNSYLSGLWVPALSGHDTYIGLLAETVDVARKNEVVGRTYKAGESDLPTRVGARYLLWGRWEQAFGGADPGLAAGWRVVSQSGNARVYEVPSGQ